MNALSGEFAFLLAVGLVYLVFGVGVIGYSSRGSFRVSPSLKSRSERQARSDR